PLERRQVVEELGALLTLGLLELGDLADPAPAGIYDRPSRVRISYPRVGAVVVATVVDARTILHRIERRVDDPIRLGREVPDLLLAPGQDGQGRGLHPAQRHR